MRFQSIARVQILAGHLPEGLLQNGLWQHVVLQGQQDSCLGGFSDGIVRTAQLHNQHLHRAAGMVGLLSTAHRKTSEGAYCTVGPTFSSLSRSFPSLMLLSSVASPPAGCASPLAGTESDSLQQDSVVNELPMFVLHPVALDDRKSLTAIERIRLPPRT